MSYKSKFTYLWKKITLLINNPSKIKHLPDFISIKLREMNGKTKKRVSDKEVEFVVKSESESRRLQNLADEAPIIAKILSELRENETFYDIGANIGTHSCFVGKDKNTKIYAFEPFSENIKSLRDNFKLNNINGDIFEVALMNEDSKMKISPESGEPGEGEVHISDKGDITIPTYKGDTIIEDEGLEIPNVIKIDVEGAELKVLKGLSETLENSKCRTIFLEIHPDRIPNFGGSKNQVLDYLKRKHFEIEIINDRGKEHHILARKT